MIKIDLLKNHPNTIPALVHIWHEVLGKIWVPDVPVERVITRFADHLQTHALPITFIALDGDLPVGMCSLRENDGIRPDFIYFLLSAEALAKVGWQSVGHELIEETKAAAKAKGAKQILVVCGAHDYPKRKFLSEQNLSIASEWFVGGIV